MNTMDTMKMTKKDFLAIPHRPWDERLTGVRGAYVIPSRRKHESGWACMDFVAEFEDDNKPMVRFGGGCDDVTFIGTHFSMDCTYPKGVIHIWNRRGFTISSDLSSIHFVEE